MTSFLSMTDVRDGALVSQGRSIIQEFGVGAVEVKAILDTIVYARTCALLKKNISEERHALLICPVHASTLGETRYVSAFLAAGADIPSGTHKSLVFLVKEVAAPVSRIKLGDLSRHLHAQSRGLVAEQSPKINDFGAFKEFGFHGMRMNADAMPEKRFNTSGRRQRCS